MLDFIYRHHFPVSVAGLLLCGTIIYFFFQSFPSIPIQMDPASIFLALGTVLLTFLYNASEKRKEFITYVEGMAEEIRKWEMENPAFANYAETSKYETAFSGDQLIKYGIFANMIWSFVYKVCQNAAFRDSVFKNHFHLFEAIQRLHGQWLNDHQAFFPDRKILGMIMDSYWSVFVPADELDRYRWAYRIDDYDSTVLSPLHSQLRSSLFKLIEEALPNTPPNRIADAGCGNGKLLHYLANKYPESNIDGVDFSYQILQYAKNRCHSLSNINYLNIDYSDLEKSTYDLVFTINSILPSQVDRLDPMLKSICGSMKIGARIIGILPSFDTVIEWKSLMHQVKKEEFMALGNQELDAETKADKYVNEEFFGKKKLDLKNQLFADDNEHPQRFFTEKEIPALFSRFNVNIQTIKRFYYPWSICKEFDWGYVEGHDSVIYDYFIVGTKLS